jgi:hypothetical protein
MLALVLLGLVADMTYVAEIYRWAKRNGYVGTDVFSSNLCIISESGEEKIRQVISENCLFCSYFTPFV